MWGEGIKKARPKVMNQQSFFKKQTSNLTSPSLYLPSNGWIIVLKLGSGYFTLPMFTLFPPKLQFCPFSSLASRRVCQSLNG